MIKKRNIRVLFAEDDYLVSETIRQCLRKIGCELAGKASDGAEAIEMVKTIRPDVVLMDIEMPGLDGLEAARRIRESCPVPVVVLTAHESRELVAEASEAGVGAYLTKPPKPAELERAITVAMARHDDLMELRRLNRELKKALEEIKTLRGILPLCSFCKKIRDDKGYWKQVDVYICEHSEADISHGICPECAKKHYPEEYEKLFPDGE